MALKKDKQKVLGEVFDDERVRGFLEIDSIEGTNDDYRRLERAYRSMKTENFSTFVRFFAEAGYDINAKNDDGLNLLQVIQAHHSSKAYCEALKGAGAKI